MSEATPVPSAAALAARAVDVALRDGAPIHVRPVRADDLPAVRAFLESLSADSRRLRFFTPAADLAAAARWAAEVDRHERDGLLALTGDGEIAGHAAWARYAPGADRAEVAFEVAETMRGRGLATILLAHLAFGARAQGIATFVAEVLPENHKMLGVFRESRLPLQVHSEPGVLTVEMPTAFTDEARERFRQRERLAAVAAMDAVLRPRSIVVVGASPDTGTIGGATFANLAAGGFNGALHAVNKRGRPIGAHACHRSLDDVPGELDLAVLAIPAADVLHVARQCGERGVRALAVLAAGFAEAGPDGAARQRELLATCRGAGMRLVGPNCLGVLNTDPAVRLDATFVPTHPPPGGIGLLSQSGGVGIALLEQARELGVGIATFASVGNKADLSGNDFIEWSEQDPRTRAILLYLESFGNPRKFARIARRVGAVKPIVAVKAGRTSAGARAASSHTGALLAGSELAVAALFRQAGVLRADTLGELFDLAALLERQPLPAGHRVAIVTNTGGPGILAADACQAAGLELPALPEPLRHELAAIVPRSAGLANPVDLLVDASPQAFAAAVEAIGRSDAVDAVIAVFVARPFARAEDVARALRGAAGALGGRLPLLSVFMTGDSVAGGGGSDPRGAPDATLPVFRYPEDAARALARAAEHASWRRTPHGRVPDFPGARADEASAIVASALAADRDGGWLDPLQTHDLLACHGLPLAPQRVVRSPTAAARAATELGGRVALKAISPGLLHKSDRGGVRLDLSGPTAVKRAAQRMREQLAAAGAPLEGWLVQAMAPSGIELLVGSTTDPVFGPVVACGLGGRAVELLRDVAVRLTPVTDRGARNMVRELGTYPLLEGYRGAPVVDVAALEQVVLRVSALVEAHPEVVELDCNPVVVHADGAVIVDARIRVAPVAPPAPTPALRR
ncbi:GNAT family N-acetyltransferase [Conexibacter stalactiti]|uniref:GNAT family N-acetyltransferase n=1 Tax=Conexibacter stalactiti TaxID=1940611 RepID=A0ABU4HZW9_9ACTN|nr:GNAT family N-acetyltransferase [Conexibacter stalactiti]MDW5598659.1 GNAT family N-acetyltransferase [Conexibacter stalactiti]MEC5039301.1 GNAT family N-acetyltransferase [Conexibacter stalactiti]